MKKRSKQTWKTTVAGNNQNEENKKIYDFSFFFILKRIIFYILWSWRRFFIEVKYDGSTQITNTIIFAQYDSFFALIIT